ncbi:MAG: hypothetical protein ACYCZF_16870 [Anaerolineae bacterium]
MISLLSIVLGMSVGVATGLAGGLPHNTGSETFWLRGWVWISEDGCSMQLGESLFKIYLPGYEPFIEPTPTPEPTQDSPLKITEPIPLKPQRRLVSCESRATANNVEWYFRYSLGIDPVQQLPTGYTDFEDYFIDRAGQNCNPNRGFRGDINGPFITACDPEQGGYGLYPRALESGLRELGVPFKTVYLELGESSVALLKELFISTHHNHQVISLWVRPLGDEPLTWEVDPETGEEYPIGTHEHCISGQVLQKEDGTYIVAISDPWPMETGLRYYLTFDELIWQMGRLGLYMAQIIGNANDLPLS